MAQVAIRSMTSSSHILLDPQFEVEDVASLIARAGADGKSAVVLEVNGGGYVVLPVGGNTPYTITEK